MEALTATDRPDLRQDGAYVFHHPPKFMWSDKAIPAQRWNTFSLYFHVPFCRKICNFCTFERRLVQRGAIPWFVELVNREFDLAVASDDFSSAQVESVYFGGGTASLLPNQEIGRLLARATQYFKWSKAIETTLECEPGTKRRADFQALYEAGVNRISIGLQTFSDRLLAQLNRAHTAQQSVAMVHDAREAGFENIHIDLMYGLPGQGFEDWKDSVNRCIDLGLDHVSTYPLIVFDRQLLSRLILKGSISQQPVVDEIDRMRVYASEAFASAGFERYSLTEFARPGKRCRYVTATWDGSDYLGFGPGAYSRAGRVLWEDSVFHSEYESLLTAATRPVGKGITMSPAECVRRDIAMGLCMLEVNVPLIERRSGASVWETCGSAVERLCADGLLSTSPDRLSLTEGGIRYATHVMKCFTTNS